MKKWMRTMALLTCVIAVPMAEAADAGQEDTNKKNVLAFYEKAINDMDFEAASEYMGERYIQHNPMAADGREGLKDFITFLRINYPKAKSEIKQVFADGDYVILHVLSVWQPGTRGRAIVDIFRLENGKVVEHWDVIQDIPEKAANPNSMF